MTAGLFVPLGVALGLGLLVGLQREWAHPDIAGIRTFSLLAVLGVLTGAIGEAYGGGVVAAAILAVTALVVVANHVRRRGEGHADIGLTTEVAALVMVGVGVLLQLGHLAEGVVVGGVVAVLLQAKERLHGAVRTLSDGDVRIVFRFVLVALVVLPVLPDRRWGPYGVLNPFDIWRMVVLIVGISTAAWVASRLLGPRRGIALTGLLGGLISSTATTVDQVRRPGAPGAAGSAAFVVLMASAAAFGRILLELRIVAGGAFGVIAPPVAIVMAVLLAATGVQWRKVVISEDAIVREPRGGLGAAMAFGFLYALVLVLVAFARENLGLAGVYGVAALSGLTDVDAITLSTARLVRVGSLEAATAWRVVLVAALANVAFKGGIVAAVAGAPLRRPVLLGFAAAILTGVGVLATWP